MFKEISLPEIVRECRHTDRCIYLLDGPQALRHLDALLEGPEIHAIQWGPGASRDQWRQWLPVYRRIQDAGKAIWLSEPAEDADDLFESLRPEGLWWHVTGVSDRDSAEALIRRAQRVGPGRWL